MPDTLTLDLYQNALASGFVQVAVCRACGGQQAIPAKSCFQCGAADLELRKHFGSGKVFSWVVCHYPFSEEWRDEVPYTVLLVELDGGGRVYGRLEGQGTQSVAPGMEVHLIVEATRDRKYPVYRASAHSGAA